MKLNGGNGVFLHLLCGEQIIYQSRGFSSKLKENAVERERAFNPFLRVFRIIYFRYFADTIKNERLRARRLEESNVAFQVFGRTIAKINNI